jgi:small conductance mechanosensitive channel
LPPDLRALDVEAPLTDRISWRTYSHELGALAVNLVVAMVILVLTLWAARALSTLVRKGLLRANRHHGAADATLPAFGASITRYLVVVLGAVAALQQLGVQTTSVLAVLGAASIAIGLALQGALSNVAAGVMILVFRPYRIGDLIETAGKLGVVRSLDLFVTELATPDNLRVVVPNGKVFGDVIVNWTHHDTRRVDVVFRVDPKQDLAPVLAGLKAVVEADKRVLPSPAPIIEATALTEAYAEGAARAWVRAADYADLHSDLTLAAQRLGRLTPPPAA